MSAMSEDGPKRGRPSSWTPEIADEICRRTAEGETLNEICRDDHMPARKTVNEWSIHDYNGFSAIYARAKDDQLEFWAQEIVTIAEDGSNDWQDRQLKNGDSIRVVDREHVERSKLRIDTRKWLLAKLKPRKYGDRVALAGDPEAPLKMDIEVRGAADEIRDRIASITTAAGAGGADGEPH